MYPANITLLFQILRKSKENFQTPRTKTRKLSTRRRNDLGVSIARSGTDRKRLRSKTKLAPQGAQT